MSDTTNEVFRNYPNEFEDAISRYSPTLFRVALRRLRNIEDAEDAVQEALLSAHKHIGQFEGRSRLSTWLTAIVTNVAIMRLRKHSRHETFSLNQDDEKGGAALASKIKDASPNPEAACAQLERDEILRRALVRLSSTQRSAIELCELEGFSRREAAQTLGISTNTLKSRVLRGRTTLSLLLRDVRTRPATEAAPVVSRKVAVRRRRCDSEAPAPPASPVEHVQNWYPPRSLENTTHAQPQRYAT